MMAWAMAKPTSGGGEGLADGLADGLHRIADVGVVVLVQWLPRIENRLVHVDLRLFVGSGAHGHPQDLHAPLLRGLEQRWQLVVSDEVRSEEVGRDEQHRHL